MKCVMKFGGSSVAGPAEIKNICKIISEKSVQSTDLTVVVSAQAGVTDQLIKICQVLSIDWNSAENLIKEIESRHHNTLKELLPAADPNNAVKEVSEMCRQLTDIARGAFMVGEVTPRTHDIIISFGERLSAYCVTAVLQKDFPAATFVDARQIIVTDDNYGHAKVNFERTNKLIEDFFSSNKGIKIVTGFIASSEDKQTTTLGRSGSDYTAAILGAALDAEVIEIWTDVDGVMTADPRFVEEAHSISQMTYNEAMELSHFGAKVIFPATMQPAMAKKIPIRVKNTFNPSFEGTLISSKLNGDAGFIKGITSLRNISLINVAGSGMVGVVGVSARMFTALSQKSINVILISQASSEHSICVVVAQQDAAKACALLKTTFKEELSLGQINSINNEDNLAIVAVVGENMKNMPGVATRVFTPLGRNGINVIAISQGSSELNISIVIEEKDLKKALNILHQSLFYHEKLQLHLYFAGTGAVGKRVLEMIDHQKDYLFSQKIYLQLCGLINSRKMLISEKAFENKNGLNELENGSPASVMSEFVNTIISQNLENSVFIDLTAADEPVKFYHQLLTDNIAIVAANKRANTKSIEEYKKLKDAAKKRNVPFHYETNVGAGLPVINVLRSLMASGDKVIKIEAVLSGTMNYLLSEYTPDQDFADLVKVAKDNGFTESDPRDDLSGMDVARKCLILARECGWEMELDEIPVEPLMNTDAANAKDVNEFFIQLKNYNKEFENRFINAEKKGMKLRYVAMIEGGKAKVTVMEVDKDHPFYTLKGTENCISLTTNYYQKYPMVVKGPGAGVDVTAAGVLADIVRIAEGLRR